MALALCLRRSASRLASSVCGGRVRSISTVVNRQSLVADHRSSPLHLFVSRRYSTAATDDDRILVISPQDEVHLRVIDGEFNLPVHVPESHYEESDVLGCFSICLLKDRSTYLHGCPPVMFPFQMEDPLPRNRTKTLTREYYDGDPIKVVVTMPLSLLNEPNDDDGSLSPVRRRPLVVTLITKSGRNLELLGMASSDDIAIDDIRVCTPTHCLNDPEPSMRVYDTFLTNPEKMIKALNKYVEIKGIKKMWLDSIKELLKE